MTRSVATSYGSDGIRASSIAPDALDTVMLREEVAYPKIDPEAAIASAPIPRLAHPSETSLAALFLASDESAHVTVVLIPVNGGLTVGNPDLDVTGVGLVSRQSPDGSVSRHAGA